MCCYCIIMCRTALPWILLHKNIFLCIMYRIITSFAWSGKNLTLKSCKWYDFSRNSSLYTTHYWNHSCLVKCACHWMFFARSTHQCASRVQSPTSATCIFSLKSVNFTSTSTFVIILKLLQSQVSRICEIWCLRKAKRKLSHFPWFRDSVV